MSKAETNSGLQNGGGWECEKVNRDSSLQHLQGLEADRQMVGQTGRFTYRQAVLHGL